MGFWQMNIWKHSAFKGIASMFSSPAQTIICVMLSENGIGSKIAMALGIGWCSDLNAKMSWMIINKLLMPMEGVEGLVLPISQRSYIPLDPLGRLSKEERAALIPLDQLAEAKWREARSQVAEESNKSANAAMMQTIAWIIGIIVIICVGILFFRHH